MCERECVCVRERGVLVFPASTSIKSQPLESEGRKSCYSSSVFAWFCGDLTRSRADGCADKSACLKVGYRKRKVYYLPSYLNEERGDESASPVFCCVRSTMKLPCWMAFALLLLLAQTALVRMTLYCDLLLREGDLPPVTRVHNMSNIRDYVRGNRYERV